MAVTTFDPVVKSTHFPLLIMWPGVTNDGIIFTEISKIKTIIYTTL